MRKPKIQPLVPLITRRRQIPQLFFFCHCVPLLVPRVVAPDVVDFRQEVDCDVGGDEGDEDPVAAAVAGGVVYGSITLVGVYGFWGLFFFLTASYLLGRCSMR